MSKKFAPPYGGGYREFYMPTTGQGLTKKRNRKNCKNYNPKTGFCWALWCDCVGPSTCKKYSEKEHSE